MLVGVSALALAHVSRQDAIKDAKRLTEVVGREVVQPNLSRAALRGAPAARARLDRVIRTRVLTGDFVRVKIWSPGGRVLYSDRPELIGSRYGLAADERSVLRDGGVEAEISDLSRPENRFERSAGKLLEVYMPIRGPGGHPLLFETYLRYDSVTASGRDLWGSFLPPVVGALLVMSLVQLPLARSLARQVERYHNERETALQRALDSSELERRRIAADLHDGTVQELVAATYALSSARERLGGRDEAERALKHAEDTCRSAVRQLRSLLVEIYPPRLRESGLVSALEDLLTPLEQKGIKTSVQSPSDLSLPYEVTALLYRAAREAVRNATEHAHPRELQISVDNRNGRVVLQVADDGVGFSPAEALDRPAEGHFGLRLLSDQARDMGGTLEVDSAPRRGTRLRMEVPTP